MKEKKIKNRELVYLKKIKDINHAALLVTKKNKLQGELEWEGQTAYWVFQDNGKIDELIEKYINNEAIGKLKKFTDAQKTLKEMLHR